MKKTNMFKVFITVTVVLMGLTFTQCGVSDKDVKRLAKEANDMLNCPVKIDYMTMLDSIYAVGKEIHYHYTLIGYSIEDIDDMLSKEDFERNIRTLLLSTVNADNKDARAIRSSKIMLIAEYFDENSKLYTTVRVGPKEYE
jgi:hypothetical protein